MPKRPRSHQLEEESWKAFSNAIPNYWILRRPQPDYGLDGEVEIFNQSGSSTGLMFLVQLKGTDTVNKLKALSFPFSLEMLDYYKSLPMPVLLVRYHSPSKELYFRWVHGIDPYYSRKKGSKSVSVKFKEENKWTGQTPDSVVKYLKIFKQLHNPNLPLPIKFVFDFPEREVFSVASAKIESMVRDAAGALSDIISFQAKPDDELTPKIKITNDLIEINIAGIYGCTFHISPKTYSKENIHELPHDVLVAISLALHGLGHDNIAADIAKEHILASGLRKQFEVIREIAACFALARRVDLALNVAKEFIELYGYEPLTYMIFSLPAFKKVNMTDLEFQSFKELHIMAINKAKDNGDLKSAAMCCYNLGNHLRKRASDFKLKREVFKYYRLAAKYDPAYKTRPYFWAESAGLLFLLDKFGFAETFYNKALELGAPIECMALRADALMFAGRYMDAKELFEGYANKADEVDSEWLLKLWVLPELIRIIKIEKQIRYPLKAMKIADIRGQSSKEAEERFNLAFEYDGLCGLAWFNRGVHKALKKDHKEALISFLIEGLIQPNDTEAWSNVLFCVFNDKEYAWIIPHVLSTAYFVNGEDLIRHFAQIVEQKGLPQESKNMIINAVGSLIRELKISRDHKPILRFFSSDGTHQVIDLT